MIRKTTFVGVMILAFISSGFGVSRSLPTQPAQALDLPDNARGDCLEGVYPGETGKSELIALLGEPALIQPSVITCRAAGITPTRNRG